MLSEIKNIGRFERYVTVFVIIVCYGFWMVNVTTPFELYSYKGSLIHNFLTYYFQYRGVLGIISMPFLVFNPYFMMAFGMLFVFITMMLLQVLFKRLGATAIEALAGTCLWMASPFFLGYSTYGEGMVVSAIGLCVDVCFLLIFNLMFTERSGCQFKKLLLLIVLLAISCSIYEAHVSLLLTGCFGIILLQKDLTIRSYFQIILRIAIIFISGIFLWAVVHKVPPFIVEHICGLTLPRMGGSHNTVFWLDGRHTFIVNFISFFVGIVINWVYTALFVHGLRFVIMLYLFGVVYTCYLLLKRKWVLAARCTLFLVSVFALPFLQCSTSNFRTHYFFMPFIGFGAIFLLRICSTVRWKRLLAWGFVLCLGFFMMRETSTQYYYRWKVSHLDEVHWTHVLNDLWRKYGLEIEKPVVFVGGFMHYPTVWDDLRPNAHLPLLNNPFVSFSYFSGGGVPREAYIVIVQKLGFVFKMPDAADHQKMRNDCQLRLNHPAYPHEGYIYEFDNHIVVNLGSPNRFRKFRHADFNSPSEKFATEKLYLNAYDKWLMKVTNPIRQLAKKYPWVWNARGGV